MAHTVTPDRSLPDSYRGLPGIFEFRNDDGDQQRVNCGQAAACTFLTHYGKLPSATEPDRAHEVMTTIEADHPPDNLFGWFGTSPRRVELICQAYGVNIEQVDGEGNLRARLDQGQPVMVMVGTEGPRFWRFTAPAGHWMVAFGYDDDAIFLTNGADVRMPWDEFRGWWASTVPRLVSMQNTGLAAQLDT